MEVWVEIIEALRKNKLRTFLTGFSVSWGIFILIVLVSFGNSIKDFTAGIFGNDMNNTMFIYPKSTSLSYKGSNPGRRITFENSDLDLVTQEVPGIDVYSARLVLRNSQVKYGNEKSSFIIRCVHPVYRLIEASRLIKGRFLNQIDFKKERKSAVIGISVKKLLFGEENAVGKYIEINKIPFKVVGVHTDDSEDSEKRMIYLPISTAQNVFSDGEHISNIVIAIKDPSLQKGLEIETDVKNILSEANNFDSQDDRALFITNKLKETERIFQLLSSIKLFTIFIGILSIISGSIGVMNIMVISVKERTKEIGLRRALGAKPSTIISSIIQESVFITIFFGYIGLLGSAAVLSLINSITGNDSSFKNLLVNIPLAIFATLTLVFVGVISGLFPAIKASRIRPVEALNNG